MRIFILAHGARGAGAVSVARNLIAALARTAPEQEYVVTFPRGHGFAEMFERYPSLRGEPVDTEHGLARRWFWETRALPRLVGQYGPDVVLALADRGLLNPPCPQAVLVHRPQLFYPPEHYGNCTWKDRLLFRYHGRHLARSLKRTDLLLCQTEVARQRLLDTYPFDGRVEICPNAVSEETAAGAADVNLPDIVQRQRGKNLLFCLTRYYGHKNLEILLDLFDQYGDRLEDVAAITTVEPDQHPHAAAYLAEIGRRGLDGHILNVGRVPQDHLGAYYKASSALLLPTLLESFSGTYLEAMFFQTPILTSDLDFAHAICGDAAVYFDPWSPESIWRVVRDLLDEPGQQEALVRAGRQRREGFVRSWDSIAVDLSAWLRQISRL